MRTSLFVRIRLFLIVILSGVNIYFGGHWVYSRYIFDYRDVAWKQVSNSFTGDWARGMDKIEEKTNSVEWMRGAKRKIREKAKGLSDSLGLTHKGISKRARLEDARRGIHRKEKQQKPHLEDKGKQELLARAKKMGLGPRASELYASNTTTEAMEQLRKKDLDFYSQWLLYSFSANFVLIISLFFFGAHIRPKKGRDYISLDDE